MENRKERKKRAMGSKVNELKKVFHLSAIVPLTFIDSLKYSNLRQIFLSPWLKNLIRNEIIERNSNSN